MVLDNHLLLGEDQGAITTSVATTNLLDMVTEGTDPDVFPSGFMAFHITTTGTGAGTVDFKIQDCDTEGGTYVDIAASGPAVATTLEAGDEIKVPLPGDHRRYIRGYFTVVSTVGALTVTTHLATN